MKRTFLLLLSALLPLLASAYDAQIDGIYYNFSGDEATVTYRDYAFNSYSGNVVIPESVTFNDKTYSVTSISSSAFYNCSGLTSITIPNSVTSIGDDAFEHCTSLTSITIPNSVTNISRSAFYQCSSLTSITIPSSVTSIGERAFRGCLLRNVFVKCLTPPITPDDPDTYKPSTFSQATYHHATLYVPTGCWDAYAFGAGWFWFNNIRETAVAEEEVSMQQAYTLMDASTFAYSVYDPVNDRIGTINSAGGINEDNPNHSWQMIEADGWHYLYNIGARKYVRREGDRLELTDTPEPIELADSDNGLILGGQTEKPCVLVSNERMSVAQSAIDVVTSIKNLNNSPMANGQPFFNLAGQRIKTPQHGINIIGNGKVLVK